MWCTQRKQLLGFKSGCVLTSFAMIITNAGKIVGTEKNYDPVDIVLANNYQNQYNTVYKNKVENDPTYHVTQGGAYRDKEGYFTNLYSGTYRFLDAYWYHIPSQFNASITYTDALKGTNEYKINYIKEKLKTNPWGVLIGGKYAEGSYHYIVARPDANGNIVFDDPASPTRELGPYGGGAALTDISQTYGLKKWDRITTVVTINPKLADGKWLPGPWEKCVNDANCPPCYKHFYC